MAPDGKMEGSPPVKKGVSEEEFQRVLAKTGAGLGDLLILVAGPAAMAHKTLDAVRQYLGKSLGLLGPGTSAAQGGTQEHAMLWITDFPMFEWLPDRERHQALHHPFTRRVEVEGDAVSIYESKAHAYDLVFNGYEIGGGSLRNHDYRAQLENFRAIGLSEDEIGIEFG